jgi:hypothetical protein
MSPSHTLGQQQSLKERLLGTWMLVSIEAVRQDRGRSPLFGADPKGIAVFDRNGHYIISVMRSDRPAFAVNDRMQGTAEENKATSQGTITYFGTYSVNETDRTMLIDIDASSGTPCHDHRRRIGARRSQIEVDCSSCADRRGSN